MDNRKKMTALLFLGLLLGICSPAWSANAGSAGADISTPSASPHGNSPLGILSAALSNAATARRERDKQCRASQVYSQHDLVGDPETCIMNRFSFGNVP
jgi:hypothetical protein